MFLSHLSNKHVYVLLSSSFLYGLFFFSLLLTQVPYKEHEKMLIVNFCFS